MPRALICRHHKPSNPNKMSNYGYTKKIELVFPQAVSEVKKVLKEQGFGLLVEIDVQKTMQEKLGKIMDEYIILGVCNPALAAQALDAEQEIGLLLPCNVIVYRQMSDVYVSAILPNVAMSFIDNEKLQTIAHQAEQKLKAALDNLKLHEKII